MTLKEYTCGLSAGDTLRLLKDLPIHDQKGSPTGEVRNAGETSTVLMGNPAEPGVIWLRWTDGEVHTWDETILSWFEPTVRDAEREK